VVYDRERHRVHRLNRAAALVWRHCDGKTTVAELAALLQRELGQPANEEVVWLTLDRLEKAHLLQRKVAQPSGAASPSRRQMLRRLARTAAVALVVPVVTTIIAPTPARAQSLIEIGLTCRCVAGDPLTDYCCCCNNGACPGATSLLQCTAMCVGLNSTVKRFAAEEVCMN
jgi:hypothetical protein